MHHGELNTLLVRKRKKTRLERTCWASASRLSRHWGHARRGQTKSEGAHGGGDRVRRVKVKIQIQ
jgi:hypothetical protein